MRLASIEFSAFWEKSEIQNQRLDMMSVIEFSDLNTLIAKNLKLLLYAKKDLLQFLNSDFVELNDLLIKGQQYVQQRDLLEKQISEIFDINPQSRQSYFYAEIYCESFDVRQRKVRHFVKNSKLKLLKQLKKEDLGINIFRQKSCMVYITLLNPIGYIKRVSNTFEQLFGVKGDDAVGKSCNFMMPDVIAGIHDDFLKYFVERGNLHNLKKGIIFGFGKRLNGFMFALHARTKLVIDKQNDFGVAGYFEEVNPDYDYFLCDPDGGILDVTERIFAYCFYDLWKLDKKKIENLDVCKLIPLLSYQIHQEHKHIQATHYQTLMCIPITNEMMTHFRKIKKIEPTNDVGNLLSKFKNFNQFIFLEVNLRYEQIDTAIGASVKFVEITHFRRIRKEPEIIESLNSLKQELSKLLDICFAVKYKSSNQNKKTIVEVEQEVVKQSKNINNKQESPISQEIETDLIKQVQCFKKSSFNFNVSNNLECNQSPNKLEISDFIKISNQNLMKSPRVEENQQFYKIENTDGLQITQCIQSPKYEQITERSQIRDITSTNRDQQYGFVYDEDNFQSDKNLFSVNRDENCILRALKETERNYQQNQENLLILNRKPNDAEINQKVYSNDDSKIFSNNFQSFDVNFNQTKDIIQLQNEGKQVYGEIYQYLNHNNEQLNLQTKENKQQQKLNEENNQQNLNQCDSNQQNSQLQKQNSDQTQPQDQIYSQSSGLHQTNTTQKNQKQTNSTMLTSQIQPFTSSLDNKQVIQTGFVVVEKNKSHLNIQQIKQSEQQVYLREKVIQNDEDSSISQSSQRKQNIYRLISSKRQKDYLNGQGDQNNLFEDIFNNSEKEKEAKKFNGSSSIRSTSSELHSKKLAIIEEIMHKKPPKFADIFIKIGKISGLILLTMCIIQFFLANNKIKTLEQNNDNEQSIAAFTNNFLKIVSNVELIRNIKGFNLNELSLQTFNVSQIQSQSMFYLQQFKKSMNKYYNQDEEISGIEFFNTKQIQTTFIGEFSEFTSQDSSQPIIQSLNFFIYYAFNYILNLEDNSKIQGPIYTNFVTWINSLIEFQSLSQSEMTDSLNTLTNSLEVLFTITCLISFFSIVIILPVNISVESKKEDLLKLMCTFPPEKMIQYINLTEDSIVKANQNYLIRMLDNKLNNGRYNKIVKYAQNTKKNGDSPQINSQNLNVNFKSKKKTISQTSSLKKTNFSSIILATFIFCLLIIQPAIMFIVTKNYINQIQDNYLILNTLNKDSLLMNQLLSSLFIQTNYIRVKQNAQTSQIYPSTTLPNLQNYTNNLILSAQEQNNQMYTLQQKIQNCQSISQVDRTNFIQLLNSNLCIILPTYIANQNMNLPDQNYIPCNTEIYKPILQQGVIITQTKLQSLFKSLISSFSLQDYSQYTQSIYQFDSLNNFNQMTKAQEDIDLSIISITTVIYEQVSNDISYLQILGICLFCFQLIIVIILYYFLWQRILAKIKLSFFSIKYILTLFTIDQLLENSYLSNYFQKTRKATINK
ncbi:transmembrane protein, putative (macronuclear) [Tetrahymena thermophila SB210]|uniref:Transmembrane protein, putative n=1 Tax=Tetrahymena thermophila (strain SB210) TaxID=312017 RepID=Q22EI2_TETTS|nr:transmembrane protein, putative [Tetrahymena thermophila SB210]EAR83670.2 transmembrane protein, putative [Tetrahymena thermophila SB210]|eukprot:XP_001031333.2 transmembrane protein, putative [Tetrahymena thermophila SB210]